MLEDSTYSTFGKMQNYSGEDTSGLPGVKGGERSHQQGRAEGTGAGDEGGDETLLY